MSNFYLDTISHDPRFNSASPCRDLSLLEPVTRAAVLAIMEDVRLARIDYTLQVTETYRSHERQVNLYKKGNTKLKNVGVHHYGLAVDFCKIVNGKASWDGDWSFLGLPRTQAWDGMGRGLDKL